METITIEDLCLMMHTSRKTLLPWVHAGILPCIRIGNRYTFTRWDIIAFQKNVTGLDLTSEDDLLKMVAKKRRGDL